MKRMSIISLATIFLVAGLTMSFATAQEADPKLPITKEGDFGRALDSFKAHVGAPAKGISTESAASAEETFLKINSTEVTVVCGKGKKCEGPFREEDLKADGTLKEHTGTIKMFKGSCYVCSGGHCYNYC